MTEHAENESRPEDGGSAPRVPHDGDQLADMNFLFDQDGDSGTGAAQPAPAPYRASSDGPLASPEMADLYVRQGKYERGIEMYRQLLLQDPGNGELEGRLQDAETLADLLTVRDPSHTFDKGYKEGYRAARTGGRVPDREVRIARLNAWLERVQGKR